MSSLTFYGWATTSTCRVIVSVFRRNRNDTVKLTKPRAKRMADTKARARRLRTMIYIYIFYILHYDRNSTVASVWLVSDIGPYVRCHGVAPTLALWTRDVGTPFGAISNCSSRHMPLLLA